jgi:hypothetical protein
MPLVQAPRVLPGVDPRTVVPADIDSATFAAGYPATIRQNLPYIIIINGDSVAHNFTFTFKSVGNAPPITATATIQPGTTQSFPTMPFTTIQIDTAGTGSSVGFCYSDLPIVGPSFAGGSGPLSVQLGQGGSFTVLSLEGLTLFKVTDDGNIALQSDGGVIQLQGLDNFNSSGVLSAYTAVGATVALGLPVMRGIDDRQDVAATDGAPITVYAVPATAATKFRITATVVGSSGTVTSAIYTIIYTVDGVTVTHTVTISAVDTDATYSGIVTCDASTNVTAQLTTLTGAGATVDLTCLVEGISSNA